MTKFCVFRMFGPMASSGDVAVGDIRPSYGYPSKSSVLGMVAAAFGIRRDEECVLSQLAEGLRFGVLIESKGRLVQDFHTVQAPHSTMLKKVSHVRTRRDELQVERIETIVSRRDYFCDMRSVVFLWDSGPGCPISLDDIPGAFQKPVFTLYMGRKSCPLSLPVQGMIIEARSIPEAYAIYPSSDLLDLSLPVPPRVPVYWEGDADMVPADSSIQVRRRDQLRSRRRWQYADRDEWYSVIPLPGGG